MLVVNGLSNSSSLLRTLGAALGLLLVLIGAVTTARAEPGSVVPGKLATWEQVGPGILVGDFSAGYSHSDFDTDVPSTAGGSGGASAELVYLSVQAPLLSLLLLKDFFQDRRWRLEDYERLGGGLGLQSARSSSGAWFGVDYGVGGQGLFRISNLVDVGARFYGGFFNDTNLPDLGKNTFSSYGSARLRVDHLYLELTRQFASGGGDARLNIVEARYVFDPKGGKALGVRVDFATFDNGQPAPFHANFFGITTRITYTYASF